MRFCVIAALCALSAYSLEGFVPSGALPWLGQMGLLLGWLTFGERPGTERAAPADRRSWITLGALLEAAQTDPDREIAIGLPRKGGPPVRLGEGSRDRVDFTFVPSEMGLVGHTHPRRREPGAGCSPHDRRVGRMLLARHDVRFYALEGSRLFRCF